MRQAILAALLGAALLAGCGGDDEQAAGTPAGASTTDTIRIKDFIYDPAAATVRAGQRIAVRNGDTAPHTLTDRPADGRARFDTAIVGGRKTGSFTAPEAGTYEVFCELHPFMKGKLTVVG